MILEVLKAPAPIIKETDMWANNLKLNTSMKKLAILACAVFALASCTTTIKTAKTADAPAQLLSATVADLEVSPNRVVVKYVPEKEVQRAGLANAKRAAEQVVLNTINEREGENYDVLVNAEYVIKMTSNFIFGKKIDEITVSGHPAKYKNFHSLEDGVWCDPVFRGTYRNDVKK